MARPRYLVVALVLGSLVTATLAGCGGGKASPRSSPTTVPAAANTPAAAAVRWSACHGDAGPSGYQCATVMVPRDPTHAGGPVIAMAIDRRPATGVRIGSLVVNPGGPGASGVDSLSDLVPRIPSDVLARFDIVGFDPPGVARTAPITCLDSTSLSQYFHVDPEPPTAAGFADLVAQDRIFAAGCESQSGSELPYVSTQDAARDMDFLRQALGDAKLSYLGFSYGSVLGATYAGLFPSHVRALVLDGAIDPGLATIDDLDQQSASLDAQLHQFFSYCTANASCPWKPGPDPTAAFMTLLAKSRSAPLPAKGTTRTVGPSEVLYGTAVTLYSTNTWNDLAYALQAASAGDGTDLLELFDAYTGRNANGTYSNLFEANAAVNCLDAPAPTLPEIQADAAAAEAAAPIFGLQNLYSEAGCSVWPVPATGRVAPIRANGSPPILVVGSTGDPVTPYRWAQSLASELANGVLLTRVGDGHTAYPNSSCIRTHVDQYLISLTVPPAGTRCSSD